VLHAVEFAESTPPVPPPQAPALVAGAATSAGVMRMGTWLARALGARDGHRSLHPKDVDGIVSCVLADQPSKLTKPRFSPDDRQGTGATYSMRTDFVSCCSA
jgi:hypothetical protein